VADLYLQDNVNIELDELTLDVRKGLFKLEQITTYPYEKADNVWVSVTLERNLAMTEFSRTIYTGFDFLSDVGGLSGILMSALAILVHLWNYNSFENSMASVLFKYRRSIEDGPGSSYFKLGQAPNCLDIVQLCAPQRLHCCRRARQSRALAKARNYLDKEVNIYKIIRMRRYMMEAIKVLLPREKRKELIKRTRYRPIEIDATADGRKKHPQEDSFFESSETSGEELSNRQLSYITK